MLKHTQKTTADDEFFFAKHIMITIIITANIATLFYITAVDYLSIFSCLTKRELHTAHFSQLIKCLLNCTSH